MEKFKVTEVSEVAGIVESVVGAYISDNRKIRKNVEARMIYTAILLELGYSMKTVMVLTNKNQSNISQYISNLKQDIKNDSILKLRYLRCRELVGLDEYSEISIPVKYIDQSVDELVMIISKLASIGNDRLYNLFKFIHDNTPVGYEQDIEKKIRKIFDE